MGKGDRRSKRGKIVKKTFGVSRPKKRKVKAAPVASKPETKDKPAKKKKTTSKKKEE